MCLCYMLYVICYMLYVYLQLYFIYCYFFVAIYLEDLFRVFFYSIYLRKYNRQFHIYISILSSFYILLVVVSMPPKNKPGPQKTDSSIFKDNHQESRQGTKLSLLPQNLLGGSSTHLRAGQPIVEAKSEYENENYMGVNQVLVYNFKGVPPTFYVPVYLRMRVNRVNQINYIESKAEIETEIRIWLMIKQFPKVIQDQIINQAKIQINGAKSVPFEDIPQPAKLDSSFIRNKSKFALGFLLSEQMELNIQSDPFWSPYELIKLIANLQIKRIDLGNGNPDFLPSLSNQQKAIYAGASVEFNFLDAHPFLQFSFGQVRQLGSFDIAENLVDMKFSNDSIKDDDQQELNEEGDEENQELNMIGNILGLKQKVKAEKLQSGQITPDAYEHGQILIPLYKYPSTTIINVFVPLFTVAIMNLGVFFQGNDMSNRDASLATFLLAYIAFLPTIRQNLPTTPKLVFTQILVYIQIICSLICFFYSLVVNKVQDYVFVWSEDGAFLVCVALTALNMSIVIGMFIIHKLIWERQFNKLPKGSKQYIGIKSLNTDDNQQWWNEPCDEEFKQAMKVGVVKPFKEKKKKKKKGSGNLMAGLFGGGSSHKNQSAQNPASARPRVHPAEQ